MKYYRYCLLLGVFLTPVVWADASSDLHRLFRDEYANGLREDPLFATSVGVSKYNDRLPSVSPQDEQRRLDADKKFLARLVRIDRKSLSHADQVSYDVFRFIKKNRIVLAEFRGWRMPMSNDSGFYTDLSFAVNTTPFRTLTDYENYLSRLEALPRYLKQNVSNMKIGLVEGLTQPKIIMPSIEASFASQLAKRAEEHRLYLPFKSFPDTISKEQQKSLLRKARTVLDKAVLPAFRETHDFLVKEYMQKARATVGLSSVPEGEDYYRALVRFYTTLENVTPESIHELGLKEVVRIRKEMEQVIQTTGFKGSFAEFLEYLRNDKQFYVEEDEQLLKEAAWIAKRIDGVMPKFFGNLPRQPYGIEPVPIEIAPVYTTGRYIGAPLGGDRGGYYWVNTYALDKRPLYELPALTLHEGVPGHHHQIALSKEQKNVPDFRKAFYPHAFGEGWGLYAEKLGIEMGVYSTPYENFGRLTYEMWRACRLVIDTGLHLKGWTREQAENCLIENTALSMHNIRTEVDRYISWPGQALAYKMGELTILKLRKRAKTELGSKFNLRQFHDVILSQGGVPMDILRRQVEEYIERVKLEK